MSLPHEKFREIVFLSLYSYDLGQSNDEEMTSFLMKELSVTRKSTLEAQTRSRAIIAQLSEIDALIANTSTSYAFSRIQSVERNALRLGVFELFHDPAIPPKVAIAEAMRITRKFATPSAALFVNAVLDQIYQQSKGEKVDEISITQSLEALNQSEEIARQALLNKHDNHPVSDE